MQGSIGQIGSASSIEARGRRSKRPAVADINGKRGEQSRLGVESVNLSRGRPVLALARQMVAFMACSRDALSAVA